MITGKIMRTAFVLTVATAVAAYTGIANGQVIEKGLVHYWSFDKIEKDIVPDLVGKNDVEIIRGKSPPLLAGGRSDPKVVKGKLGTALEFDGDGDYAQSTEEIEISGFRPPDIERLGQMEHKERPVSRSRWLGVGRRIRPSL